MANEKRLIDANEMSVIYCDIDAKYNGEPWMLSDILAFLNEAPTVDAVEVVHGRWEDQYDGKYANPRYRCSVCKEKALYKFERDSLGNHRNVQALTPICPYCSAKLDGGNNNDI